MNMNKKNGGTTLLALVTIKNKDASKMRLEIREVQNTFATERKIKKIAQSRYRRDIHVNTKGCIVLVLRKGSASRQEQEQ